MSSFANYFEERGLDYLDFNVLQTGVLFLFRDLFQTATFILPACAIRTLVSKTDQTLDPALPLPPSLHYVDISHYLDIS
jgi:hypothetical protein